MSDEDDLIEDGSDDDDSDADECFECGLPLEDCDCDEVLTGSNEE
jgi:hypothetical protein